MRRGVAVKWWSTSPVVVLAALIVLVPAGAGRAADAFGPQPGPALTLSSFPESIATADFNGDGAPDLAIAERSGDVVTYLHNEVTLHGGHGTEYSRGPGSPIANVPGATQIVAGVFTSSGNVDLAVSSYTSGTVTILLGDGQGDFTQAPGSPVFVGSISNSNPLAVGQFVTGKSAEIAVLAGLQVQLIGADSTGTFGVLPNLPVTAISHASAITAGRFTSSSGNLDLAVLDGADSTVQILQGDGAGSFGAAPGGPIATGLPGSGCSGGGFCFYSSDALATGNFDGDTHPDIAAGSTSGQVAVLLGQGNAQFTAAPGSPITADPSGDAIAQIATGNLGGTAGLDGIATADYFQGGCEEPCTIPADAVSILQPAGGGRFAPAAGSPYTDGGVTVTVAAGDFNIDGLGDVAFGDGYSCFGATAQAAGQSVGFLLGLSKGVTPLEFAYPADGCPIPTPTVATQMPVSTTLTSATLAGTVDQHFQVLTDCHFVYGLGATGPMPGSVPCGGQGSGGNLQVTGHVSGLKGLSTYHFALVASTAGGTSTGGIKTFQTCDADKLVLGPPLPAGAPASYGTYITGCFTKDPKPTNKQNQTWTSTGGVEVNGLSFTPSNGGVHVDPKAQSLSIDSSSRIGIGPLPKLPLGPHFSIDLSRESDIGPSHMGGSHTFTVGGFKVSGTLKLSLLPHAEAQITGSTSMNVVGDPVQATIVLTLSGDGFAGIDVGVGPADADPLEPTSLLDCNPKVDTGKNLPAGFSCNEIKQKDGSSVWKLTPYAANPGAASHYLLPACDPSKGAPPGWSCEPITLPDGSQGPDRLVAANPGIVKLGPIGLEGLEFSYTKDNGGRWSGGAIVRLGHVLPGGLISQPDTALEVSATIEVNPFRFDNGSLGIQNVGLLGGELNSATLSVQIVPSFKISGSVSFTAGPAKTMSIDGSAALAIKWPQFDLKISGDVQFETWGFGGYVEIGDFNNQWKILLAGSITRSFGPVSLTGQLSGGLISNPFGAQLGLDGSASVWGQSISIHGVVSTAGIGACGQVSVLFFSGELGFKHFWANGETDWNGCDFSGLYVVGQVGGEADAAAAVKRLNVAPHTSHMEFAAVGASAPPDVVLTSPGGATFTTPAAPDHLTFTRNGAVVAVTNSRTTYFDIAHPAAGTWTIAPAAGASPPLRYEAAAPLRPLELRTTVTGTGPRRVLRWHMNAQRGVTVQFVQLGGQPTEGIATVSRSTGRLPFEIARGPETNREIKAVVAVDGVPRQITIVARFILALPSGPQVTHAQYRVKAGKVRITWRRPRGVESYEIDLRLSTGTRAYLFGGRASSASITLPDAATVKRVTITATGTNGITAHAVSAAAIGPHVKRKPTRGHR